MKWIVDYIISCFCKHDFEYEEQYCEHDTWGGERTGIKVSATCKKCGYHKSYWKF